MKVVIIGASHSGLSAASDLRKLVPASEIVLIDQQPATEWGYISNGINLLYQGKIKELDEALLSIDRLKKSGIKFLDQQRVFAIDAQAKKISLAALDTEQTQQVSYDYLVIATGSSNSKIQNKLQQYENVLSYKTIAESKSALIELEKAQKVAIFGNGYIGVELADELLKIGKEVYLIDTMDDILYRYYDKDMIQIVEEKMTAEGLHYYPREYYVDYSDDGKKITSLSLANTEIEIDLLVLSKALLPNTELLKGVVILNEDKTVRVNEYLQTSDPFIYAIGDLVPIYDKKSSTQIFMPLVNRAVRMGRAVALSIAGKPTSYNRSQKISTAHVFGFYLGTCGITEKEAPLLGYEVSSFTQEVVRNQKIFQTETPVGLLLKLVYEKDSERIIGFQLVSREYLIKELDLATMIVTKEMTLSELAVQNFTFSPQYTDRFHIFNNLAFSALQKQILEKQSED